MSTFFDEPSATRQLGLQVEDRTFWVTEQILALHSLVFEAMFYGQFKEAKDKIISLPGKKASDILEMLLCIFPTPTMKEIDDSNVNILLPLADEYQMEDLKRKCEKFLCQKVRSMRNQREQLLSILCTASKYALTPLVTECAQKCLTCCRLEDVLPVLPKLTVRDIACVALYMANDPEAGSTDHKGSAGFNDTEYNSCSKCDREEVEDYCRRCKTYLCHRCMRNDCEGKSGSEAFENTIDEVMKRKTD